MIPGAVYWCAHSKDKCIWRCSRDSYSYTFRSPAECREHASVASELVHEAWVVTFHDSDADIVKTSTTEADLENSSEHQALTNLLDHSARRVAVRAEHGFSISWGSSLYLYASNGDCLGGFQRLNCSSVQDHIDTSQLPAQARKGHRDGVCALQ